MADLIDISAEKERLGKEIDKLQAEIKRLKGKIGNKKFADNAPAEVVDKEKAKLQNAENSLVQLQEQLEKIQQV
jgi:valyl-tRNA synthetase